MPRYERNRLLGSFAQGDLDQLVAHLQDVALKPAMVLFEPGQPISHIYFPLTGIVSLIVAGGNGSGVQVATIGHEGVVGLGGLLANDVSFTRQVVELGGDGVRLARAPFLAVVNNSRHMRTRLAAHADAFTAQLISLRVQCPPRCRAAPRPLATHRHGSFRPELFARYPQRPGGDAWRAEANRDPYRPHHADRQADRLPARRHDDDRQTRTAIACLRVLPDHQLRLLLSVASRRGHLALVPSAWRPPRS